MTLLANLGSSASRAAGVRTRRRWVSSHEVVTPLVVYLALAFAATASVWSVPSRRLLGTGEDPELFVWFLRWTPWAITHGHNPLFTDHILYPSGANLMWNTSVPLLGVLFWPVTATAGPVASYNALIALALLTSALAAYVAFRDFTVRRWPAIIGGALYGFSPYMMGHALGHLHMLFAFAPPLTLLLFRRYLSDQARPATRRGVQLGLLIVAQALIGEEMLALTAIGAAVWLACLALTHRRLIRQEIRGFLRLLTTAAVVSAALLAVPLGWQFAGPQKIGGRLFDTSTYSADLLSFVLPNRNQLLGTAVPHDPYGLLSGGPAEAGGFLLPSLLVAAAGLFLIARSARRIVLLPAGATAAVAIVLSLGPRLHINGRSLPVPLPARLVQALPVTDNIVATRFLVISTLCLALLATMTIDAIAGAHRRHTRLTLVAVVLAFMAPRLPLPSFSASVPSFFAEGAPMVTPGSVALIWPNDTAQVNARSMLDQAVAGMRFRLVDGYALAPLRNGQPHYLYATQTAWTRLLAVSRDEPAWPPTADLSATARSYLLDNHVRLVIVPTAQLTARITWTISAVTAGIASCRGGVCLWQVTDHVR